MSDWYLVGPPEEPAPSTENEKIPFVGFCAVAVKDGDGHVKQTKGSNHQGPVHTELKDKQLALSTSFCPEDPLNFIQLSTEENSYLCGAMWFGSSHRGDAFRDNVIVSLVPSPCERLLKQGTVDSEGFFVCQGRLPFLPAGADGKQNMIPVKVFVREHKFITRVVRVEICLSQERFEAWKRYHHSLYKASKVYEKKKEDDKKSKETME